MNDKTTPKTEPTSALNPANDPKVHLTLAASFTDPKTGAVYVHRDLAQAIPPWESEAHIGPMATREPFGDVESFVTYVARYSRPGMTYLTWNAQGLRAVLDYADESTSAPGRCQWTATLPFRPSLQWQAWTTFANGQCLGQKSAVERLEDLAGDIVEPTPTDLMALLRSLRASVNAKADTELRPDGTTQVKFERDARVQTHSALDLPASFAVAIPVLKGHVDANGRPVVYRLDVRVRVSIDDGAKLTLRFTIPGAERVLEDVYADRVAAAKALLGDEHALLRAAD